MNRYIDSDSVRDEILYGEAYVSAELEVYIKRVFDNAPTADVAPVVHGKWEKSEDDYCGLNIIKCSLCREEWCFEVEDDVIDLNYKYCPNCGSKMDLEE